MSTEHVSPSQHNEPLARREKIHNQGLHILLKMETVTGLSIIPGAANQRIRDRGSLSEIDSLITTAQQAYAERPRHGSLYALETDRTEVFQHNLNGPDSRLRFHDGVYFSNQQPYPLCFIARQHSNTEIYLKQLGQDKDEMRYFQAFACQAGAALFRLQPRWLTLGPPAPEPDRLWVEAMFFHAPSNTQKSYPTLGNPVCIENPWAASMSLLQDMRDALTNSPTTPPAMTAEKPTAELNSPAGESRQLPDGPFDADGFRFDGVEVRFGTAVLQYRLIQSLWNKACSAPALPRPLEEVLVELYGEENETEDSTFRQLCSNARKKLEANHFPLTILTVQGKVQLKSVRK